MFLCPRDVWFYLFALICISIWRQFGLGVHHTLSTGQWRRPGLAQQEQVLFLFPRWRWLHLAHGAGAGELQLWEFLFCRRWSTKSFCSTNCRFSSSPHVQAKIRCARAGQIEMRMSKSKWDAHVVLIASNFMIKCRAWKVLSDERNRIAIGQGRPEIHRFEVRCFEQKLDKLSRYLNLNDRKRLSKSRYSKTFQLRFVSTKNCSLKCCN